MEKCLWVPLGFSEFSVLHRILFVVDEGIYNLDVTELRIILLSNEGPLLLAVLINPVCKATRSRGGCPGINSIPVFN